MTPRRHPRSCGRLVTLTAALLAATAAGPVEAQAPPGGGPPPIDRQVSNDRPKFLIRASVDRKYRIYSEGDQLTLKVRCEEDAYLYVLYQQADGKVFQIFPNSGQPDNRIKAMQDVQVPSPDDGFRWVVGAPLGKEIIKVVASKKPVDALSLPGLKEEHFNPVTSQQVAGAGQQLGKEPPNVWSEHDLKITTVKKGESAEPPEAGKRVGVFFGVSEYEFNDVSVHAQRDLMAASGGKVDESKVHKLNLGKCHRDAADMARVLKEAGGITEARVFLNGEVTRDTMREAITGWLPSVTRPGDTVFLFFSGHGDQIPDDGNDEKDGMDETLDTTELMDVIVFNALVSRKDKGQLPPELAGRVDRLKAGAREVYQRALAEAGGEGVPGAKLKAVVQVNGFLMRSTSVTDDEIGHWVQKLDGRRVVVILDACKSGGMAAAGGPAGQGQTRYGGGQPGGFDFLQGEFARLKDLDQPSLTVLSAAAEEESSVELGADDNGMFTGAILRLIAKAPGPVDGRQAVDYSKTEIAERLARVNAERARRNETLAEGEKLPPMPVFSPQLFTTDPRPVYLKPPTAPTDADPADQKD